MIKRVYTFGEGDKDMKNLLGGKGANLSEMTNLGLRVPPGFTVTTTTCVEFFESGGKFPEGLWEETMTHVKRLEEATGKRFGDIENPLLVSVRSGAPISMPGMMDSVLNLGLNDDVAEAMVRLTGEEWFVFDAYRRLITMFGNVVMHAERQKFDAVHEAEKEKEGVERDTEISVEGLKRTVEGMKKVFEEEVGRSFPLDPIEQLRLSIAAVFNSWNIPRAITYRKAEGIPDDMGTACNVQVMVFGNMGWDSGSGVMFTRNPATGEKGIFGELLFNAQGEDVVAGIRTPMHLRGLEKEQPELYNELEGIANKLEAHYTEMQDLEFTIENGILYILQTRTGKRTAKATIKIAVDMAEEGLIDIETAIMRITPKNIDQLLHPQFDPEAKELAKSQDDLLTVGLNASPGAATGIVIFDADTAEEKGKAGENVILVRPETTPDDVNGMLVSQGFLTQHGGGTSHAAVVARGWGKPCVAGAEEIRINTHDRLFTVRDRVFKEGDWISIDGATGEVFAGIIETRPPNFEEEKELVKALEWADEIRKLGVRTNADTPEDSTRARMFGAEGIGLTRTEHMFFDQEGEEISRRENIVKMILQSDTAAPILRRIADLENKLDSCTDPQTYC
jgi:pyruvate,orthophosphate dikinase